MWEDWRACKVNQEQRCPAVKSFLFTTTIAWSADHLWYEADLFAGTELMMKQVSMWWLKFKKGLSVNHCVELFKAWLCYFSIFMWTFLIIVKSGKSYYNVSNVKFLWYDFTSTLYHCAHFSIISHKLLQIHPYFYDIYCCNIKDNKRQPILNKFRVLAVNVMPVTYIIIERVDNRDKEDNFKSTEELSFHGKATIFIHVIRSLFINRVMQFCIYLIFKILVSNQFSISWRRTPVINEWVAKVFKNLLIFTSIMYAWMAAIIFKSWILLHIIFTLWLCKLVDKKLKRIATLFDSWIHISLN